MSVEEEEDGRCDATERQGRVQVTLTARWMMVMMRRQNDEESKAQQSQAAQSDRTDLYVARSDENGGRRKGLGVG
jgi:hypothetical protein